MSMPRCFAVVRTLERKKRSSTDARIATGGSYFVRDRRQAFFLIESRAVPDGPGDERHEESRNRHRAADVEQEALTTEDRDDVAAHQLQRAGGEQDAELGRTNF